MFAETVPTWPVLCGHPDCIERGGEWLGRSNQTEEESCSLYLLTSFQPK